MEHLLIGILIGYLITRWRDVLALAAQMGGWLVEIVRRKNQPEAPLHIEMKPYQGIDHLINTGYKATTDD